MVAVPVNQELCLRSKCIFLFYEWFWMKLCGNLLGISISWASLWTNFSAFCNCKFCTKSWLVFEDKSFFPMQIGSNLCQLPLGCADLNISYRSQRKAKTKGRLMQNWIKLMPVTFWQAQKFETHLFSFCCYLLWQFWLNHVSGQNVNLRN